MNKVAIVTGGGRGIGAAICQVLAAEGFCVAINYLHDAGAARRTSRDIKSKGGSAFIVRADVAVETDVVRLFQEVRERVGPPQILINNAGSTGGFARVEDLKCATLERAFAINVFGAFICSREAVRAMSERRGGQGGVIVNISSRAAELGGAGEWVHYAATKGALDTLTRGLAREVATEGIRVNAVAAGLIETELHASAGEPGRTERLSGTVPMGRPGFPLEVADAVRWLVSPGAKYVTGAIVAVSGGR